MLRCKRHRQARWCQSYRADFVGERRLGLQGQWTVFRSGRASTRRKPLRPRRHKSHPFSHIALQLTGSS